MFKVTPRYPSYRINLVSLKNIDIWLSYEPKITLKYQLFLIRAYVFGYNSAIFWPIRLNFFMGTQETIIYRLVMRNLSFGPYLPFWFFWPCEGQKWAWPHACPYGSGVSKLNQKVDPLGGPFAPTINSKSCFWNLEAWTPLPPLKINSRYLINNLVVRCQNINLSLSFYNFIECHLISSLSLFLVKYFEFTYHAFQSWITF